jgi:hypothetical protein
MKTLWRESALPSVTFILVHSGFICLRRMPLLTFPRKFCYVFSIGSAFRRRDILSKRALLWAGRKAPRGPPHRGSRSPIMDERASDHRRFFFRAHHHGQPMPRPRAGFVFSKPGPQRFVLHPEPQRPVRFFESRTAPSLQVRFVFSNPSPPPRRPLALFFRAAFSATYRRQVGLISSEPTGIGAEGDD